jgi:Gpi18-like mannosyltransferase
LASFFLVVGFFFTAYFYREKFLRHRVTWLYVALLSLMLMPFFLPTMHERYFFAADVFSVILAATVTQRAWLPVLIGAASLAGYTPFLFQTEVLDLRIAALCNLAVICVLLHDMYHQLRTPKWPVAKKT